MRSFINSGSKSREVYPGVSSFIVIIRTLSPIYIWYWVISTEAPSKSICDFLIEFRWLLAYLLSAFTSRTLMPRLWRSPSTDCELYTNLLQVRRKTMDYFICFFFQFAVSGGNRQISSIWRGSRSFLLLRANVRDSGKRHWSWHLGIGPYCPRSPWRKNILVLSRK